MVQPVRSSRTAICTIGPRQATSPQTRFGSYSTGVAASSGSPIPANGIRFLNNTVSDANGYFYSGGNKVNAGFGGACENCTEVSGSVFHDVMAACFSTGSCHDNEFYNVDKIHIGLYDSNIHSQIIEDDSGGNMAVYNNYLHDFPAAVAIRLSRIPSLQQRPKQSDESTSDYHDAIFCFAQSPATATVYL